LAETVTWCSLQPFVANGCSGDDLRYVWQCELAPAFGEDTSKYQAASILRTPSLKPPDLCYEAKSLDARKTAIRALAKERMRLLGEAGKELDPHPTAGKHDWLLLYEHDMSDVGGAALVGPPDSFNRI
jgi:hypothetical protein